MQEGGSPNRRRRAGKRPDGGLHDGGFQGQFAAAQFNGDAMPRPPRRGDGGVDRGILASKPTRDVVHHHPPKEMAQDVGFPVRGGQTLLIAYFPWEASEVDVEREFAKFARVKRVHLVVDKSSRKPRCFGFVKFISKADAEEALHATTQGLVQLPDTRGHVWHLKAEWTKSGDMVVDDSETEQEVAKRKEERRSRVDHRSPSGEGSPHGPTHARSGRWPPSVPLKGALHPGIPPPLPPLQNRYPPVPSSLGFQDRSYMPFEQSPQNQMPMMHHDQNRQGQVQQSQSMSHNQQVMSSQQHVSQSQHVAHQMPSYGSQQGLPAYNNNQGQQVYGGHSQNAYGMGTQMTSGRGSSAQSSAALDQTGVMGGTLGMSSSQQNFRDYPSSSSGYGQQGYNTQSQHQQGYPSSQQGYGPQQMQQNYAGQQGYLGGQQQQQQQQHQHQGYGGQQQQQPFVAHQTYGGQQQQQQQPQQQQQTYGGQHQYSGQQAYAGHGYAQQPQQGYSQQQQHHHQQQQQQHHQQSYMSRQGNQIQSGFTTQQQGYASQQGYSSAQQQSHQQQPQQHQHQQYSDYGQGVVQPGDPLEQGMSQNQPSQGPYGYPTPSTSSIPPPGVVADGVYTGGMSQASGRGQPHASGQPSDEAPSSNKMPVGAAYSEGGPSSSNAGYHSPIVEGQSGSSSSAQSGQTSLAAVAAMHAVETPSVPGASSMATHDIAEVAGSSLPVQQAASGPTSTVQANSGDPGSASVASVAQQSSPGGSGDAAYIDMVWQLSEMSLHEKALGPPTQQPPAPPASHVPAGQWQTEAAPQGRGAWESATVPGQPLGSGPSAVWSSFDDAAVQGMVDGLVGGEDGTGLPLAAWNTRAV